MFNNIGGKIKGFASFVCLAGIIGSIVLAVKNFIAAADSVFDTTLIIVGIAWLIGGFLISWIGSFALYGFGQLIESSEDTSKQMRELITMIRTKEAEKDKNEKNQAEFEAIKKQIKRDEKSEEELRVEYVAKLQHMLAKGYITQEEYQKSVSDFNP